MRTRCWSWPCFALLMLCGSAGGAEPAANRVRLGEPSLADVSPTTSPEIWLYMQELRRYEDPKLAVRRKAEIRAAQRRNRLAAMQWFGLSNSRPVASVTPFMGTYSPTWVSNGWNPFVWVGAGYPWTAATRHDYYGLVRY